MIRPATFSSLQGRGVDCGLVSRLNGTDGGPGCQGRDLDASWPGETLAITCRRPGEEQASLDQEGFSVSPVQRDEHAVGQMIEIGAEGLLRAIRSQPLIMEAVVDGFHPDRLWIS